MQRSLTTLLLAGSCSFAGCSSGAESESPRTEAASTAPASEKAPAPDSPREGTPPAKKREPTYDFSPGGPISDADLANYHVALACSVGGEDVGTMTIDLWTEAAPITTRNFLRLCDEGFYDGLTFHRILREFMVQGGDPLGNGMGDSPHGTIQAEFSEAPERAHGYGVLSMARMGNDPNSASCQFFVCCDESPSVWALDGQYASFGRVTSGVATLEALANAPTVLNPDEGAVSKPADPVVITRAEAREGTAPAGEVIARPPVVLDLHGEPEKVVIQHVLVSFAGAGTEATRTKEEAAALARKVLERAQGGEDFAALVRELSDDLVPPEDESPGVYKLLNHGVRDPESERALFSIERRMRAEIGELQAKVRGGEITAVQLQEQGMALQEKARAEAEPYLWSARKGMVPAFGDVGFSLEVGGIGMAEFEEASSPFGWHVIKRLE